MLDSNKTTQLDTANIALIFNQIAKIANNYAQDFNTLLQYANTPIGSEKELLERAEFMDKLADMATSNNDITMIFVNAIADRIEEYEDAHLVIPKEKPSEVLAGLMKIKNTKQVDLKDIAKQSVISELLSEKRTMNIKQVKGFAKYFNVPESLFMG